MVLPAFAVTVVFRIVAFASKFGNAAKENALWKEIAEKKAAKAKQMLKRAVKKVIWNGAPASEGQSKDGAVSSPQFAPKASTHLGEPEPEAASDTQQHPISSTATSAKPAQRRASGLDMSSFQFISPASIDRVFTVFGVEADGDGDGGGAPAVADSNTEALNVFDELKEEQEKSTDEIIQTFLARQRQGG